MASWWTSADMLDSLDLEENSIVSRVIQAVGLFGDILSLEDTMEPMLSEVGSRDEAVKRPEEKMVMEDGKGEDPEVEDWKNKDESRQKNMTIEGSDGGHTDVEKHEVEGMTTKVKEKQDTEGEELETGTGKVDLRNEGKKDEGSMEQEQEIKREEECKEGKDKDEDEVEEKEEMVEEDKEQGRERGEEEQDEEEENEVKEEEERDEVDGSDKEKTRGHQEKERREEDRKEEEQAKVERDEEEERGLNKENNEVLGEDIETHDEEEDDEENIMKESGDDGEEKEERHEEEQLNGRGEKELEDKEEKEHDMEEKQVDKEKEVVQEEVKETDNKEENTEEVEDGEQKMEKEEAERENKEKEEEIMEIEEIMEGKKEEVGEKEEKMEGKEDVEEKEEEIVGKEVKMKEKEEEKENKNQDVGRKEEVMEGEELKVDENKDPEVGRKEEDMETVAGQDLDFAGTLSADIAETGGGAHTVTSDEEKGSDSARDDEDIRLTSLSKHKEPQAFLSCTDASTQTAASEPETDTNLPSEDDSRDAAPRPQTDPLTSGCRPKKRVTLMDTAAQSSATGAQRGNDGLGPTQHSPATGEPGVEGKEGGEKIPKVNGEGDDKKSSDRQSSKYKTVSYRRIRRGNTKLRIDEFEAMINS